MKPVPRTSLQIKLFVSFALIVVLTTALGYVFVANAINNSFESFLNQTAQNQFAQYAKFVARDGSGDFVTETFDIRIRTQTGSHEIMEGLPAERLTDHFAFIQQFNLPVAITNVEGEILVGPDEELEGQRVSTIHIVMDEAVPLGEGADRFLVPLSGTTWRSPLEESFIQSIPGALVPAGLIVGGIALLLSFGIVGQAIAPLRKLDLATRTIAQGNFDERVDVKGTDELSHLAVSFNNMAASLSHAEKSKRNLIADVYHELRTPISIVQSGLEGLIDGVIEPSQENLAALHDRTQLIGRLVNDLQQLALADAGQLSIEKRPCDIQSLLSHIETAIGAEMEENGIELLINYEAQRSEIEADVQRIEQVILNLLSNARRHTPQGGRVEISVSESFEYPEHLQISVCDTGPGIPPEDLENIFDRFYRSDKSRARASGGSGLGLTIAKVLIEAHGGRIWAENTLTGGACVRFVVG